MKKETKDTLTIIVIVILLAIGLYKCGASYAGTHKIEETFDTCWVDTYGQPSNHVIDEDIIGDTSEGYVDKIYYEHALVGSMTAVKVMVKQLKLNVSPKINDNGRFATGTSTVAVTGLDPFYSVSGLRYTLPEGSTTLSMAFKYHNLSDPNGKLTLVIQNVADDIVEWEEIWHVTGYKSWVTGWQTYTLDTSRFDDYLKGRAFNTVWVVGTSLSNKSLYGSYIDDLTITSTTPEKEPIVEPIVEEPEEIDIEVADAIMDIGDICPCSNDWKNHGEYVSCVAQAGKTLAYLYGESSLDVAVTEAAKAECGKGGGNKKSRIYKK